MRNLFTGAAGLAVALSALFAASIAAQVPASDPARLAAAFGARERVLDASLSPDGTKVAFITPGPAQATVVQVLDVASGEAKAVNYVNGDPMTLRSCGWASNNRLVCTLYGVSDREGPLQGYQRMVAMNADGSQPTPLGIVQRRQDYISNSDGYVVDWRDGATDQVLIARNYVPLKSNAITVGSKAQGLAVDLLDTRTGKVNHVESANPIVQSYVADGRGVVRIKAQDEAFRNDYRSAGRLSFYYRLPGDRAWKPFSIYDMAAETGMYPIAVDGAANVAYVLDKVDGRDQLFRVALDGSMKKELAFADPRVDVSGVARVGRRGRVVGARFTKEYPEVHYFDPQYEALHTRLGKALPRLPLVEIMDSSADEMRHLVFAQSDTDAGRYYLYDQTAKKLMLVGTVRPDLDGVKLGGTTPITYPAADGTPIPGYLTLPAGATAESAKGLPAIVLPHGGPSSRDTWGFDWLPQFFAARGYAVLQPNYRGSSGYGQQWFQKNGFRSWKVAVGDVADAGRWLVKQGIADAGKLAILGWSYGGYAALQSQVVDPDLFKAVVAIAPVTDLGMLRSENELIGYGGLNRAFIGDGPHVQEGSPARHAAKFKAPVLLFHGTKDINVAAAESAAMHRALRGARKKSEYVAYPDIDHQLPNGAVRTDMLARTDKFLTAALGR